MNKPSRKTTHATRTPLFKELSNVALVDAYWAQRELAANAGRIANLNAGMGNRHGARNAVTLAMRATRNMDIIIAIARQRGINLLAPQAEQVEQAA